MYIYCKFIYVRMYERTFGMIFSRVVVMWSWFKAGLKAFLRALTRDSRRVYGRAPLRRSCRQTASTAVPFTDNVLYFALVIFVTFYFVTFSLSGRRFSDSFPRENALSARRADNKAPPSRPDCNKKCLMKIQRKICSKQNYLKKNDKLDQILKFTFLWFYTILYVHICMHV